MLICASLVFIFAVGVRLHGTAWDQFASLHPDERHLLFVMSDIFVRWTADWQSKHSLFELWFDTSTSPLNPRANGASYVYGELPLLLVTLAVKYQAIEGWENYLQFGRSITAIVEASTCLAVFMASYRLTQRASASLLACLLYAASPTALQLSNFYTVDAWLIAMTGWAAAALIFFTLNPGLARASWVGLFCGLAVACKATGLVLAIPVLLSLGIAGYRFGALKALLLALNILVVGFLVFRVSNPFVFSGPGFFGFWPSEGLWRSLAEMSSIASAQDFPPNWQWMAGYSSFSFWRDFILFGCGPILFLVSIGAALHILKPEYRHQLPVAAVMLACSLLFINLPLLSDIRALRYTAPALAPLAILASLGLRQLSLVISSVVTLIALWWGSGVFVLHGTTNSRVEASQWLWQVSPKGSVLLNETGWDDGLPVKVAKTTGGYKYPTDDNYFTLLQLQITDQDTPAKAANMAQALAHADYVIQSSGRQRDVMPRLPRRFPMTAAFYSALKSGFLCFTSAWDKGDVYPLPLLPFYDGFTQETWRVYDHPRVIIYRPLGCRDGEAISHFLQENSLSK